MIITKAFERQPIVPAGFANSVVIPDSNHRPIKRSDPAETHPVGFVVQLVLVPSVLLCAAVIHDFLRHGIDLAVRL